MFIPIGETLEKLDIQIGEKKTSTQTIGSPHTKTP